MVIWNPVQDTLPPFVIAVLFITKSALLVPTVPVATTVVVSDLTSAKYPAVPEFPAVPEVIAFAVAVTIPPLAVAVGNAVAENVIVASSVPVTAPFKAGCAPVKILMKPLFSNAVTAFTPAITVAS